MDMQQPTIETIKARDFDQFLKRTLGDWSQLDTPEKLEDYGIAFPMKVFTIEITGIDADGDTLVSITYFKIVCP